MKKLIASCFAFVLLGLSGLAQSAPIEVDVTAPQFGAMPNDGIDDTAQIQAALDWVRDNSSGSGGLVRVPAGTFRLDGRLQAESRVDFRGAGMLATRFSCTTAGAGITIVTPSATADSNSIPRGGTIGHFTVAGGNIAANPLHIGWGTVRLYERIRVEDATDVGLKLEEVQNSVFVGLQIVRSGNIGMVVDFVCRTTGFFDCVFSGYGIDGVLIKHTGGSTNSLGYQIRADGPRCSKLQFSGGVIDPGASSPTGAGLTVTEGTDISVDAMSISGGFTGAGVRLLRAASSGVSTLDRVSLRGVVIQAGSSRLALEVKNNGGALSNPPMLVTLESGVYFSSGSVAIETDDDALINAVNYASALPSTSFYQSTGSKTVEQVVRDLGSYKAALTAAKTNDVILGYNNGEKVVIENVRARVNELEDRLRKAGLIK